MNDNIYFKKYLSQKDFLDYWKLVSNEKAMVMNYGRVFTFREAKQLFDCMLRINLKSQYLGYFKVFNTNSNTFIGIAGINANDSSSELEIEYMLFPQYWGKEYGTKIVDKLISMAKQRKNIKRVIAITDPNNVVSKKLLVKYGFNSLKIYKINNGSLAEMFVKQL
ncbi:hypothetical protein UT300019_04190 [Clostridium sp. CTA-19]